LLQNRTIIFVANTRVGISDGFIGPVFVDFLPAWRPMQ